MFVFVVCDFFVSSFFSSFYSFCLFHFFLLLPIIYF